MSTPSQKWIQGLQSSSLFRPPPQDAHQRQAEILAYVELFGQFTSEEFPDDIAEIVHSHYPNEEASLLDDVLAIFVLHHPEHGHAFIHPLLSCIIDGTLIYDKKIPPFNSFISLFSPSSEKDYSEQWALACGEILRVLTHYNRPVYKVDRSENGEVERRISGDSASTSRSKERGILGHPPQQEQEKKPLRLLTPWITDILLAAPLGIRSDYFRWCGGVMGKYIAGGELKPPTTAGGRAPGKHPQLMPSTPRWAVANGAGVILSVCDDEVSRYETANLTAAAVPALLLPPPTTALDEHLVAGLPPLEPFARLFHRYYAIATPSATQRLLLGLLEAPPSWAPDALDAAVQLVELLRAAEDYASAMQLPKNWMHLHFLRAIGTALSMRGGIAADAAAALLFRILSQPALLFPPPRHAQVVDAQCDMYGAFGPSRNRAQMAAQASVEATAQGVASLMCAHGPEVEWRICTLWEAAYGLLPLSSSTVDLPEIVVATPLQPPVLSWNIFHPLLRVLEYLPRGSPSEASLLRIFTATVEAILQRTFPAQESKEQTGTSRHAHTTAGPTSKNLAVAELRAMVHSLFTESSPSLDLAPRLLFVVLTACLSHDAVQQSSRKSTVDRELFPNQLEGDHQSIKGRQKANGCMVNRERGAVATFDSYVLAAVCALACEVQLFSFTSSMGNCSQPLHVLAVSAPARISGLANGYQNGMCSAVSHTWRLLGILEALLSLKASSVGSAPGNHSSSEIVAAAMVAAHVSDLLGRSKACMHALSVIMRCKWDPELCARASSVLALVDVNGKAVAAIADKSEPAASHVWYRAAKNNSVQSGQRTHAKLMVNQRHAADNMPSLNTCNGSEDEMVCDSGHGQKFADVMIGSSGKTIANLPMNVSDVATLLTMDSHKEVNGNVGNLVKAVLAEKQDLCVAAVPLLWQRLITAPEMRMNSESTSAKQGWRQVVEALCNIVLASPAKAATAIVLQAERDLQHWIARDDTPGQQMWRLNQRIVSLLTELLRHHNAPEVLMLLANSSDILLRATDGMLVDGEACTIPQLELLEAAAMAAQLPLGWGVSGKAVAQGLMNLLKCRLPATVQCLSHSSAHVRALSTSVLRDILHVESLQFRYSKDYLENGLPTGNLCHGKNVSIKDWRKDVEQCLVWEAHNRRAKGMSVALLASAARSLGCSVSV